ncbi:hypothetical protein P9112_009461 [Eukaryota sp. TZLM1-RC]
MSDIFQQDISNPNSSPNMQQQEAATHTHIHNKERNEVTDPGHTSPSLKVKDESVDEVPPSSAMERVTRTDPALSPLPIVEPVSKGTDGSPTLDTASPLGEYEKIQSHLDEMEGGDDSSEGFYKLLKEDAEAYLKPTDFCLFEQLPPLCSYIHNRDRNGGNF